MILPEGEDAEIAAAESRVLKLSVDRLFVLLTLKLSDEARLRKDRRFLRAERVVGAVCLAIDDEADNPQAARKVLGELERRSLRFLTQLSLEGDACVVGRSRGNDVGPSDLPMAARVLRRDIDRFLAAGQSVEWAVGYCHTRIHLFFVGLDDAVLRMPAAYEARVLRRLRTFKKKAVDASAIVRTALREAGYVGADPFKADAVKAWRERKRSKGINATTVTKRR